MTNRTPAADGGESVPARWRQSFRRLKRRETALVGWGLYLVAFFAWLALIERWLPMPAMGTSGGMGGIEGTSGMGGMSMSQPGVPEAVATSSGSVGWALYLGMWAVMMIAMMYPSSVPLVRLYYGTLSGSSTRAKASRLGAFLGAYTLVWTATGVVPLLVSRTVPVESIGGNEVALGGTLLLLSAYQLSPYKDRCLSHCRSPLGFLMSHHRSGVRGAARMGLDHSTFCVGCCWALFAFMVVVGTMNLVWMAAITVVLSLERTVSWGDVLARGVGAVAGVTGTGFVLWATIA